MFRLSVASVLLIVSAAVFGSDVRAPSPVKFRISGTVVNAISGQPLSKIQVSVGPAVSPSASQTITTGEDGHFQFNDLSRGKYWLLAEGRGFSAQRFDQHEQFSTAIAVGPGLSSEGLIFRLSPDATIVGTITDEQNEAVAEARVMLFRTGVQNGAASTQILNQAQTDDQGHYHLSHVPPGTYYVAVSARPWYADNRPRRGLRETISDRGSIGKSSETQPDPQFDVTYPITFYPGVTDPSAATALTLNQGDRLVVDLAMTAVQCVPLRLSDPSIQPNQGFNANIAENVFGMSFPVATAVNVLGPGEVEVSGLAPGHYSINLQTFGKTPVSREQQVDLSDDSEISMANSATAPSIKGIVTMEDGRPLPRNLNVILFSRNEQNLTAQTSANGEFEMPPQFTRPGKYQVAVFGSPGMFLKSVSATGASLTARELNVVGGAVVNLKMIVSQGTGRIDGTALRDNKPFAGAMIVLVPQDIEHNSLLVRRDQSDSDGTFSLYDVLPGSYTVVAIQNGWDLQWLNPEVLRPYLKTGTAVTVAARGRYDIKVTVQ